MQCICSFHGRLVGLPNSSLLNQFPQRPMPCASTTPGTAASAKTTIDMFLRRQPIHAPIPPSAMAPQIPNPPSQILTASIGCLPAPKYNSGSVHT